MDFVERSVPRHSAKGSKRSRANSIVVVDRDARLSVIAEDGVSPPEQAHKHRISSRGWAFGNPPRHSFEKPPPQYSFWDVTGPKGEKLTDVRNNKYIVKRGGWRRICLVFWLVLVVILALAIGLGVGLQKHNSSPAAPTASPLTPAPGSHAFPAGNFTFNTFLQTVSTNCTSNATTWTCAPYHTYANSPSESKATYDWIIDPSSSSSSPSNYTISSTANIFSITFANVPLELLDQNLPTERYHFRTPFQKVVIPPDALNVRCNYNDSTLEADLYTKLKQVYPKDDTSSYSRTTVPAASPQSTATSFSGGRQLWPYAVEITLSQEGGPDVPDCHRFTDGVLGPRLTQGIEAKAATDLCSCFYKNFNP